MKLVGFIVKWGAYTIVMKLVGFVVKWGAYTYCNEVSRFRSKVRNIHIL